MRYLQLGTSNFVVSRLDALDEHIWLPRGAGIDVNKNEILQATSIISNNKPANYTVQRVSRKSNSFSVSKGIYLILWNRYIQYSVDKSLTLVHVLSHTNTVHINLTLFLKIHFNIILPSTPRYPSIFLHSVFSLFSYEFLIQFQIPFKLVK